VLPTGTVRHAHEAKPWCRERQVLVDAERDSNDVGCVGLDRYIAAVAVEQGERRRRGWAAGQQEHQGNDKGGDAMLSGRTHTGLAQASALNR